MAAIQVTASPEESFLMETTDGDGVKTVETSGSAKEQVSVPPATEGDEIEPEALTETSATGEVEAQPEAVAQNSGEAEVIVEQPDPSVPVATETLTQPEDPSTESVLAEEAVKGGDEANPAVASTEQKPVDVEEELEEEEEEYEEVAADDTLNGLSEADVIRSNAELANAVMEFYGGNTKEAARAVGLRSWTLECIANSSARCNFRKRLLLQEALRVARTPIEQKRAEIMKMYQKVAAEVEREERKDLQSAVKPALGIVKLVCDGVESSLPEEVEHQLFWRCRRNGVTCIAEAHLYAKTKWPQGGIKSVVLPVLYSRLLTAQKKKTLLGFYEARSEEEPTVEWSDGIFVRAACTTTGVKDVNILFLPKSVIDTHPDEITPYQSHPRRLLFSTNNEEGNVILHLLPVKRHKEKKDDISKAPTLCLKRSECLLFASCYYVEDPPSSKDVYTIHSNPNGSACIESAKYNLTLMVGNNFDQEAEKNDEDRSPYPFPLSKLESFHGLGTQARDLLQFIRSRLHPPRVMGVRRFSEDMEPSEDEDSLSDDALFDDGKDRVVGTIMVRAIKPGGGVASEKQMRYVYASRKFDGLPYYFSASLNRVLVLAKERIDYFPDGIEPEEIRIAMSKPKRLKR